MSACKNFDDLCLICFTQTCQEQSYHQKYTFSVLQSLIIELLHLKSWSAKDQSKLQVQIETCGLNSKTLNRSHSNIASLRDKHVLNLKIKKCVDEIVLSLKGRTPQTNEHFGNISSSLQTVFCLLLMMENIDQKPLVFHDIVQIVKIGWTRKYWPIQGSQLCEQQVSKFTSTRIEKLIVFLKDCIRKSKQNDRKKDSILRTSQKIVPNDFLSVFKDLTNTYSKRVDENNNDKERSLFRKRCQMESQKVIILSELLQKNCFFDSIVLYVSQECKNTPFCLNSVVNILNFVANRIVEISSGYLQRLFQQKSRMKLQAKYPTDFPSQFVLKIYPQRSVYPTRQLKKRSNDQRLDFEQQPEYMEFAYIEGIPFPTTRRSIDFSMLQITDSLFLSYLPSLQKLRDLEQICIRKNKLTLISYKVLKNTFPKLRSLDIRQNLIDTETTEVIVKLKSLNILYLSECSIEPGSLIKICLNLSNLNVLYCDRLTFLNNFFQVPNQDYIGLFYIMCLNLKKLLFLSIKGYLPSQTIRKAELREITQERQRDHLPSLNQRKDGIFEYIQSTLKKRGGVVQI